LKGGERRLARLATIGADGAPHIAPVGYAYNATMDIGGFNLERTKKYRDIQPDGRVPPHGVEVRGRAEPVSSPEPLIRIHPDRIVWWGIESKEMGDRHVRSVKGPPS
jgi:pyridoxamine 5'-phosphate oxidase family protein